MSEIVSDVSSIYWVSLITLGISWFSFSKIGKTHDILKKRDQKSDPVP